MAITTRKHYVSLKSPAATRTTWHGHSTREVTPRGQGKLLNWHAEEVPMLASALMGVIVGASCTESPCIAILVGATLFLCQDRGCFSVLLPIRDSGRSAIDVDRAGHHGP